MKKTINKSLKIAPLGTRSRAGRNKLSCSKFKRLVPKLVKKLELLTAHKQDLSHNWLPVSQKNATMRQLPSPEKLPKASKAEPH